MLTLPSDCEMYTAMEARNPDYDGIFFVGVLTTGIFCRPVCPAKTPLRKNVQFFATARDALHAGLRPCKRCRPMDMGSKPPEWVLDLLSKVDSNPTQRLKDWDLRCQGFEPERVRRYFKTHYGMTFQGYQRARRLGQAFKEIRRGMNKTEAAMEIGYDSDSGFRDAFLKTLGATPGQAEGRNVLTVRWIDTPLGAMIAGANDHALCILEYVDRRMLETQLTTVRKRFSCALVPGESPILDQIEAELDAYFKGELKEFKTPLEYPGTDFQMRVWDYLLKIPYGETRSYGQLGKAIGCPDGQRAVGKANGDNRLAIIIPCHRVIKSDGTMCGYGGGLWRKQRLLELEQGAGTLF
ncbi:MAG: methylated-DNA--[protein]-cysteine S-methyltransferase [Fimbriimonadaceae bacterium]|nr:methylated-DNA--[protein]-cysteine S-methyltransferase [Fimbriimonadaceae bacterium]